ncbi:MULTISPECIES: AAA family ATPase [Fusobacterium]|uniref:AAA family ATPase n=1 Tax=Fusobacterium TaxID=848 RepID=UPI001F3E5637|nr:MULTISPECIES: AAA family ATPase [Fusobacterium]MCF2613301.1 AAA family ATPase [Fusobacterium perfoetens]MDY2980515.1 AAA family ATPase [Fusobacterium sp.]
MKIKELEIKNFRCYENMKIKLDSNYIVLIGINGSGKTTILDALSIALGGYISVFDGMGILGINKNDSHYKMYEIGNRIEREHQFPVSISTKCEFDNKELYWERTLNGERGRTTSTRAKQIIEYASSLQKGIKEGDKNIILPMVAYYGTGRLWMQKRDRNIKEIKGNFSRLKGYIDCLDSASNEKQMLKWFEKMTYIELQEEKIIPELDAVKKALSKSYKMLDENLKEVKVDFKVKSGELEISLKKNDNTVENLPMRVLSDGTKSILSMIADIAYRMAILNPQLLDNILKGTPGIILIDEIDMHLHPNWQTKIISILCKIFPKIQFIFTTHSPNVLSNVSNKNVLILDNYEIYPLENMTYGRDVESILREVMKTEVRPKEVVEKLELFNDLLDEKNIVEAKKVLEELEEILGKDDSNVVEREVSLRLEELEM